MSKAEKKEERERLKNESNSYWMFSSTQFSDRGRTAIWALLGSLWVMFFNNKNELSSVNTSFKVAFIICIIYLVVDVLQYFIYSVFYRHFAVKFENNYIDDKDNNNKSIRKFNGFGNFSVLFHWFKFIILMTTVFFFMKGIFNSNFFL